ncbi:hypothetical protein GCM10023219_03090 [Stakelama sediminis]|uniref:Vacuolar-type H+-ATPase subunit H n=1 Tax=Stakelama sediminis TaxID=463200 RepID=A0A840YZ34_9SPHN|nr:hypothetical protein [Stakelama sediminis]MBB5719061.1 vacuolar-type H+-ATPase subunit H [Stakelama sediminis]
MRTGILFAALALTSLTACHPKTPQEKQAEQLQHEADARADALTAAADNKASDMEAQAEGILNQAGQSGSFEARRLKVRADALKTEAKLVRQEGAAKARAIRDEGKAKASAVLAQ